MAAGDVLLVCEAGAGQTAAANARLLAAGDALAGPGGDRVHALLAGHGLEEEAATLRGAVDELHLADDPRCADYHPEAWAPLALALVEAVRPALVLLGHTHLGMDLAPRLAARLRAPLATNCFEVRREGDALVCLRPMYQGRVHAWVALDGAPAVATLQLGAAEPPPRGRSGTVRRIAPALPADPRIRVLRLVEPAADGADIAKADVVVAGGRGVGTRENFRLVEDLAEALGGVPACSRPLVDMGWLGPGYQVGLSGRTVKPTLYVACGISGAVEHLAGMRDAEVIVAINTDRDAPIFKVAHYGIVGDVNAVVPALIAELRAARPSQTAPSP